MIIRVSQTQVVVLEPDNFKAFHIETDGLDIRHTVRALGDCGSKNCAYEKGDGAHVWLSKQAVIDWVGDPSDSWLAGFEQMLDFAAQHGWINPEGTHIQAHIEWPNSDISGPVKAWQMPVEGATLWELLQARVAATPDQEMLVDDRGVRVSFSQYRQRVEQMAAGFASEPYNLVAGDIVSWQLPTWVDSIVLAAALSRIGVVQNPIIPIYREVEVGFCTRQAQSKLLVVPGQWRGFDYEDMANNLAAQSDQMDVLVATQDNFPQGDPASLPPLPTDTGAATAAATTTATATGAATTAASPAAGQTQPMRWLLYTSGTTADPKGARHTDASIAAIAKAMGQRLQCTPLDKSILAFPFTHIGGITWLFSALQFGSANLLTEAFAGQATVDFMAQEKVTMAGSGTPFHQVYLDIQRQQPDTPIFEHVRCCPGGGAPKPPQMHYDIKHELGGVGVVSGWGLTEAPILSMGSVDDPDEKLAHTEGRPMPGVDLRVVRHDGSLAEANQEGELRAKAPQLMLGYLDESLNADGFDEHGYFRTGDLGMLDEDGFVIITGRLKDIIIRHGENISAKQIEDLLYEHPSVQDVAVIGLPDETTGERACAVVSTPPDADPLTLASMQDYLSGAGLRKQALPEQLELVNEIPRNPSGKILKQNLRDEYAGKPPPNR